MRELIPDFKKTIQIISLGITLTIFLKGGDIHSNYMKMIAASSLQRTHTNRLCDITEEEILHGRPSITIESNHILTRVPIFLETIDITNPDGSVSTHTNIYGFLDMKCTDGTTTFSLRLPTIGDPGDVEFSLTDEDIAALTQDPDLQAAMSIIPACTEP
jgi:hypothetical protein